MPYLGNTPPENFVNVVKQDITGNGGQGYSLNHAVSSAADLEVFVNNVQQEPTTAYTVSGSTITFDEAVSSTDDIYVIFRARSIGTAHHPADLDLNATTGTFTQLNSDNIRIDGNTISSTNTNGDITLDPDGSGSVAITNSGSSNALEIATHISTYEVQFTGSTHANLTANIGANPFYIQNLGAGTMNFQTSSTDRMVIDSSGNVGIGTSPSVALHVKAGTGQIRLHEGNAADNKYGEIEVSNGKLILHSDKGNVENSSTMQFHLDNIEYARFKDNGQLAIGSDGSFRANEKLTVKNSTDTSAMWCTSASGSVNMLSMYRGSGQTFVGSVETTGSATQYASASDHRLKENVVDLTGAIDRLKTLSPRRFNFIAEPDTTLDGFIAHEVTAVPEAVTGTHNAVDDDGNPKYQGLDASKIVPLLTAALQEAIAKIETLETKVAALEGN